MVKSVEEIIALISKRDGISYTEAEQVVDECVEELKTAEYLDDCERIIADYLGLEPDYLEILLFA